MAKKVAKKVKRQLSRLPKTVSSRFSARAKRYSRLSVEDMKELAVKKRGELSDIEKASELYIIRKNPKLLED